MGGDPAIFFSLSLLIALEWSVGTLLNLGQMIFALLETRMATWRL